MLERNFCDIQAWSFPFEIPFQVGPLKGRRSDSELLSKAIFENSIRILPSKRAWRSEITLIVRMHLGGLRSTGAYAVLSEFGFQMM